MLIKRVEAVLRRATGLRAKESILSFKEITINPASYKTLVNNKEVELTYKEFQILEILISNVGRVFSRETLLNQIWGYDYFGDSRVIDTHIKNLRQKLNVDYIKTVRGVGIKLKNKLKKSIVYRLFLVTTLLLVASSICTYSIIYMLLPNYYYKYKKMTIEKQLDSVVDNSPKLDIDNIEEYLEKISADNNAIILVTDDYGRVVYFTNVPQKDL